MKGSVGVFTRNSQTAANSVIENRKIKEQMKIILAQYFEIFQISSSGKIYNKNIMKLQEFENFIMFLLYILPEDEI